MRYPTLSTPAWAVRLAAFGLLAQVALSAPLWDLVALEGAFPKLPLLDFGFSENSRAGLIQGGILALLALATGIFPQKKWLIAALLGWLVCLIVQDLNRLQPWLYCYILIFSIHLTSGNDREKQNALRWLLAAVYCWSGFNKLTPWFAEDNFAWFCSAFDWLGPAGNTPALGYATAVLEILLGLGLLWAPTRAGFRWLSLAFHVYIVATLLALDWNTVVIPWNLVMAALVWMVFRDRTAVFLPKNKVAIATVVLGGILPAFHLFQLWPAPLSWTMYANTQPEATFYTAATDSFLIKNPLLQDLLLRQADNKILLDDWAFASRQVPVFSSEHSFRQAGKILCNCAAMPDSAGLYILHVHRWRKTGGTLDTIPCRALR